MPKLEIQMSKTKSGFEFKVLRIRICFGFRASDFDFLTKGE